MTGVFNRWAAAFTDEGQLLQMTGVFDRWPVSSTDEPRPLQIKGSFNRWPASWIDDRCLQQMSRAWCPISPPTWESPCCIQTGRAPLWKCDCWKCRRTWMLKNLSVEELECWSTWMLKNLNVQPQTMKIRLDLTRRSNPWWIMDFKEGRVVGIEHDVFDWMGMGE